MAKEIKLPVIPKTITVHLGKPSEKARNIVVSFPDYIKNVASSEIYPTWPESALRANIYAQVSFALNRIYTEYYPSRGYDFDITSSTQFDQAYKPGRDIFQNISRLVDEVFNDYVVKQGRIEPYFTQFCNGTTVKCDGLSQWGTVDLANKGLAPYEILTYYYGNDINLVRNAPVADVKSSYPGVVLRLGDAGNDVKTIQLELNRIGKNFPAIPVIEDENGVFTTETDTAVKAFQRIFNMTPDGKVGKSTWYKLKQIYSSVKKLSELSGEGLKLEEIAPPYTTELKKGSRGTEVELIQYYLAVIGYYNKTVPVVDIDGIYGNTTESAVKKFQTAYGIPPTGQVAELTYNKLKEVYNGITATLSPAYYGNAAQLYPGYFLSKGMENNDVKNLQKYINTVSSIFPGVNKFTPTGYFGSKTEAAVKAIQKAYGIPATGTVGPVTWNIIATEYNNYYSYGK